MSDKPSALRALFTKELIALMLIAGLGTLAQELLSPVLSLYMRDIGFSDQNIGLAFTVMMVGIMFSELFWGWAVDRTNLKIVLAVGTFAYGGMTLVLLTTHTFAIFLPIILVYGFSRSPLYVVNRWYMGVFAPVEIMGQAFAIANLGFSIPSAIGGFVSGYILEAVGYRTTIIISACIPLTAGLLLVIFARWLHYRNPKKEQETLGGEESAPDPVDRKAWQTTFFLGSFGVLMFISLGVLLAYLPLYASDVAHLEPSQIGILFGLRGILSALIVLPLGRLADRVGRPIFIPLGMGVIAVGMAVIGFSHSYGMLLGSMVIFAFGMAMYFTSVSATLAESVPVIWVGTATGIYGLMEDVGWAIGPAVGGWLLTAYSIHTPFTFSAFAAALGVPLYLWGRHRILGDADEDSSASPGSSR